MRYHNYKFQFNLRGDNGAHTGGLAVDSNLGWKGPEKYIATVPQIFDLWADPQERYDLFMNNFTETHLDGPGHGQELEKVEKTFVKYPPRKLQSDGYTGPITISDYEKFEWLRDQLRRMASASPCRRVTEWDKRCDSGGPPESPSAHEEESNKAR